MSTKTIIIQTCHKTKPFGALFFELWMCLLLGMLLYSCADKPPGKGSKAYSDTASFTPPTVTILANLPDSLKPKVTLLNISQQKTLKFDFMREQHLSVLKSREHEPLNDKNGQPFILGEGGRSHFTTYTTENGLALDAISCSIVDRHGNLWFGTQGGGVSKYDGKSFTNYSTESGLAHNTVWSILEDKNGDIWFGTYGQGISRYNGKNFTTYTTEHGLPNNYVFCLIQDKKGDIWAGTNGGGISRFNPAPQDGTIHFTNYSMEQGLAHPTVWCMAEDAEGNIWIGTEDGVSRFNGKSFKTYTAADGLGNKLVWCIRQDRNGNLWFGTNNGGVSRYDGSGFTTYTTVHGLAYNTVKCITEDKNGCLWMGTADGGVSKYDPAAIKNSNRVFFTTYTVGQGLSNDFVLSITEDKTGNLWFGTFGGGVCKYEGKAITNYTTAHGMRHSFVFSIAEDENNNLWLGSYGGGLSRFNGKSFKNYSMEKNQLYNTILCVAKDKRGNLWYGTDAGGVCRYENTTSKDNKTKTEKDYITLYTTAQGLSSNIVLNIFEDSKGNLWFGTHTEGVCCFDGKKFTTYTTRQGLANNEVGSIMEDRYGNIWFGTQGGGISRFDGKSFTNYSTEQGLADNVVICVIEDSEGYIWIGTDGYGLSRFDGKSFANYSTAHGLPDNGITQMAFIDYHHLAIGTDNGIAVISGFTSESQADAQAAITRIPVQNRKSSEKLKRFTPIVEVYNSSTGYPIKDINLGQNCMYLDKQGILWAGTGSDKTGLVRFDYASLNKTNKAPEVFIQSLKINNTAICWNDLIKEPEADPGTKRGISSPANISEEIEIFGKTISENDRNVMRQKFGDIRFDSVRSFYPVPENLALPHNHNEITFEFLAVEPSKPYQVNYQFILEGYNTEWSPPVKATSATYGNIFEGTYTFKVRAQSPFGVWSQPVSYTFKVLPPWWRTWWMYLLYIIIIVSAIVLIVRWNNRRLISQKKKLKTKIVRATNTIREEKEKIQKANELITQQRQAAEEQKKVVEEKNKDILDSIHYAKRIQNALLIKEEYFNEHLPEYFLLFIPKDIVSGDFYWACSKTVSDVEEHTYWYVAAVDCTGHGVPGAVMSMLGMSFLNEIINSNALLTPAEVLDQLRNKVVKELGQTGKTEDSKDGMDISLVRWQFDTNEIQWAGANNPLYLIQNGELKKVKADKQPIGYFPDIKPFTNHTFQLQKGDCFYIFSDGYADQFGGPQGKKFKNKQMEELILENAHLPMVQQRSVLKKAFYAWKGELDQVDDVCVVGARVR